eukprot:3288635-Rhodomonas_salina.2
MAATGTDSAALRWRGRSCRPRPSPCSSPRTTCSRPQVAESYAMSARYTKRVGVCAKCMARYEAPEGNANVATLLLYGTELA